MAKVEQSAVFGRCIAQDYNGVYKDKCLTEFLKLKDCYTVRRIFAKKKRSTLTSLEGCCKKKMSCAGVPSLSVCVPLLPFRCVDETRNPRNAIGHNDVTWK